MSTSDIVQLAGAIGGLFGAIVGAVLWLVRRHFKELQGTIRQLRAQVGRLEESCQDLRNKKTRLENERTRLEAECSHQQGDVKKLTDERDEARRQEQKAAEEIGRLRGENAKLEAERAVWQIQLAPLHAKVAHLEQERDGLRHERDQLQGQVHDKLRELSASRSELDEARKQAHRSEERARDLEHQLERRLAEYQQITADRAKKIRQLTSQLKAKTEQLTEEHDRAEQAENEAKEVNERINHILAQEERVWERPVEGIPFQPLSIRQVPIIAVLNFKGGVGKTTLTANLAGTMAQQGKRVLVIDADYQRNLSMLLVPDNKARLLLHLQKRTLQHFLAGSDHSLKYLLHTACEVPGCADYWVVTNSDPARPQGGPPAASIDGTSLEDVEMRLMAEWMFRSTGPDVRLALREALHNLQLRQRGFRYVLIDCPPRVSTACINALAASDFFLVPMLLDATSARTLTLLLRTVRSLSGERIFPALRCLGLVANSVKKRTEELITQQQGTWDELRTAFRVCWGSPGYLFEAKVPHSQRFPDAAGSIFGECQIAGLSIRDTEIKRVFTELFQEIETRVEHESKQLATVPS